MRVYMKERRRKREAENNKTGGKYILTFSEGNPIGRGGNGSVYIIDKIIDKATAEPVTEIKECVIKVLYRVDRQRKQRFKNEILFLIENAGYLKNVVDIVDYDNKDYSWYVMPKHKTLDSVRNLSFKEKIIVLLDVALALQSIHNIDGMHAHRDVKPSNILIDENGTTLLTDFGCVFMGSDKLVTESDEFIGPALIRPQELYAHLHNDAIDYRKSDVYLFAKTCWMFLKNNDGGFSGEYKPSNKLIYLRNNFNVETIEPIHELLTLSTKEYWEDRISIDDCITLLKNQLDVCNGTIKKEELITLINKEKINEAIYSNDPVVNSFGNSQKVCDSFLKYLAQGTHITIVSRTRKETKEIIFDGFNLLEHQTYEIIGLSNASYIDKVIFCISDIEYNFEEEQIIVACSLLPTGTRPIDQSFLSRTEYLSDENKLIICIDSEMKKGLEVEEKN